MLDRLKRKLDIDDDEARELIEDATSIFLSLRYPTSQYPVDTNDLPVIEKRFENWIYRCAVELYQRVGIEGQVHSSENTVVRKFDAGTISQSLAQEISPIVGVVR